MEACWEDDHDHCDIRGDSSLLRLQEEGYLRPPPPGLVTRDLPSWLHLGLALIISLTGLSGTVSNMTLMVIHLKLWDRLMDPTGLLIFNFLFQNLGMSLLQFPFSSSSSFAGRWLYGQTGCQLYAAAGFFFGIGVIISLGLIILEGFLIIYGLTPKPRTKHYSMLMIGISWMFTSLFVIPPYMDVFGRFGLEPGGTSCTIDYWHGNFRNYNYFVLFLVIFAYMIPITTMLVMFLKSVKQIQVEEATKRWSVTFTKHQAAMTKVCGLLFLVQVFCWSPYAVLCLWTTVLPPETLNVHYTLLPSVCCKLAPALNALIVWWNIPRVLASYFYIRNGQTGPLPNQIFDFRVEMEEQEEEDEEKEETETLTPGSG